MKKTPLYEWHTLNSSNVVPFGGFLLPIYYSSIVQEHLNVRSKAGIFDEKELLNMDNDVSERARVRSESAPENSFVDKSIRYLIL